MDHVIQRRENELNICLGSLREESEPAKTGHTKRARLKGVQNNGFKMLMGFKRVVEFIQCLAHRRCSINTCPLGHLEDDTLATQIPLSDGRTQVKGQKLAHFCPGALTAEVVSFLPKIMLMLTRPIWGTRSLSHTLGGAWLVSLRHSSQSKCQGFFAESVPGDTCPSLPPSIT